MENLFLQPITRSLTFSSVNYYCDFETILVENTHYVCCFSIVGPKIYYTQTLNLVTPFTIKSQSNALMFDFIQICLELKNNICYQSTLPILFFFHNFSKFDSFFLINSLSWIFFFDINLISRNRTIYKMYITNNLTQEVLEFRDTYLLLTLDLDRIGRIFCTQYQKIKLDYSLNTLEIYQTKYHTHLTKKKVVELYCLNDSLVLQEGFERFIREIQILLGLHPLVCLSLPSLAVKYFLQFFYNSSEGAIENCSGNIEAFIRKSYRGGIAEVYKPSMKAGYHYDINSLYPYVMREFDYPVGKGQFMKNTEINFNTFFGFLEVEVSCPLTLKIPLLTKYDKFKGLTCPVGVWTDIYFSEELKVAKALGYTFKILRGISYERKKLFRDIISTLHALRCTYSKNSSGNIIVKLLMNSLYGRFGMKLKIPVTKIVSVEEYQEIQMIYDILHQTILNQKIVVVFIKIPSIQKLDFLKNLNLITDEKYMTLRTKTLSHTQFTPIQVASAITSYARLIIHKYKNDPNNVIYYSDTDSIFCKYPLHKRYISDTKLGFMKKCGNITSAYFIAPKIYAVLYSHHLDIKCKGVNKGLVSFDEIKKLYVGQKQDFLNTLLFRKNYQKFIIQKIEQKISLSGAFLKRKKIYVSGIWVSTNPYCVYEKSSPLF